MAGDKTEQASPRRKEKAREKGQIALSRELMTGFATMTMVFMMASEASMFPGQWRVLLRRSLDSAAAGELQNETPLLIWTTHAIVRATWVASALSWLAALGGALVQGGLVFAPSALAFKLERFSPAGKLKQLFSLPALGRLLKTLLPGTVVVTVTFSILARDWSAAVSLSHLGILGVSAFTMAHLYEISWKAALVLMMWAGVDFLLERQKLSGDLKMSKQDQKDEYKESEGNPVIKNRIRRLQRQMRRKRMLEEMKRASVVITNPTEFAVALEFSPLMAAPVLVAKGRNLLAQQIKAVARWQGIPVIENPPLAHALYRAVEIGQSIPPKLYTVVAEILAAIYRAEAHASRSAARGGR